VGFGGGKSVISILWPGSTATRSCGIGNTGDGTNQAIVMNGPIGNAKVDTFAVYWFLWRSTQKAHFESRHGKAGYFLVPDVVD
jgi:hypothetical protein